MPAKITPAIYRINLDKVKLLLDKTAEKSSLALSSTAHSVIKKAYDDRRKLLESKAKPYDPVINTTVRQYSVAVYKARSEARPHPWQDLFDEKIDGLEVKYPNLAAFFSYGGELYAISSGMGYTLFEQYIDASFPLELAKHVMSPEMSATTERDIAGAVYGRNQQFRSSQLIISSQNLGTVWQAISGHVSDEAKARRDFQEIYVVGKGKISVSAGSSFKIHKSIEIVQLPALLDFVTKIIKEKLTPAQEEAFDFLEGLKEINARRDKNKTQEIKDALAASLIADLKSGNTIDMDFSHLNFPVYQGGSAYRLSSKVSDDYWQYPPAANEVLSTAVASGQLSTSSPEKFLEGLEGIDFICDHEDSAIGQIHGSLYNHLHGEIKCNNETYFLIDHKLYIARKGFIDRINSDFKKLLKQSYFAVEDMTPLKNYKFLNDSEGKYNELYLSEPQWLVADRAIYKNVEIADLLHWDGDKLYVIHNKIGYGVTTRDVCSQISHSMNILNQMISGADEEALGEYYDKIISKHYTVKDAPLSRRDFIDKILQISPKNVIYVLGYIHKAKVDSKIGSNIAKFETIKLCEVERRRFDFQLKITHIPRLEVS